MQIKENYSLSYAPGRKVFKWIKVVIIVGGFTLAGLGANKFADGYVELRDGTGMTVGQAQKILAEEGKPSHLMYSDPRFEGPTDKMVFGGGIAIAGLLISVIGIVVKKK